MKNDNDLSEIDNYEIVSIIFKDSQNKEHLLTKEMQELWKNTFGLKNIDDSFIAKIPQELRTILGKDIQIKKGSLFKIVAQRRESFIPQIKEVLESPEMAIKDNNNAYLLVKHLENKDYFVNVSVDKGGDCPISISNGIKEFNNLKNKIKDGAKIIYQSPNANSTCKRFYRLRYIQPTKLTRTLYQTLTHKIKRISQIAQKCRKINKNQTQMKYQCREVSIMIGIIRQYLIGRTRIIDKRQLAQGAKKVARSVKDRKLLKTKAKSQILTFIVNISVVTAPTSAGGMVVSNPEAIAQAYTFFMENLEKYNNMIQTA